MARQNVIRRSDYRPTREYIQDGNTVRVAVPKEAPQREREIRRRRKPVPSARPRPAVVTIPYPVLFLLLAVVSVALYFGCSYLNLKSSVDSHLENVKTLETRLEALRTENDALEQSIDTSVDLNYVYAVAINKLGMVHAGAENVVRYDKTESQYVRQYEQIPEY